MFLACGDYPKPECDLWAQDCPDGQKCAAYTTHAENLWDAVKCVDVVGMDKPGDVCMSQGGASGIDSCIKGAMCWDVSMDGVGTCVALCTGWQAEPVCEAMSACIITGNGVLNLCLPVCEPLLQDCPIPTEGCYPISDTIFFCSPDASGDEGQANDPCNSANSCDKGLLCVNPTAAGMGCVRGNDCCTPFCKYPEGVCPNPDQQCLQWFDPKQLPPNDPQLDLGYCAIPN